uniref:Uncharacterized protein n=1 Tax=Pavo cristatus TaxID=9049 RepID=A0A8C9FZ06_PAVCR
MADHLKKHSEGPSNFCTICNRGRCRLGLCGVSGKLGKLWKEEKIILTC